MNKLILIGCDWHFMPVLFDVVYETTGIKKFSILQNMVVEDTSAVEFRKNPYEYDLYEAGDNIHINTAAIAFGVVSPFAKNTVFSYFNEHVNINKNDINNIIHPTAYVSPTVSIASGLLCEPHVIISSQSKIGFGVTIKRGVNIGHHNILGDYTLINPGVTTAGNVSIGKGCMLGVGAIIKDGVSIGDNTIIGMGSMVTKNIPSDVVAYGNPCREIRKNISKSV